MAKIEHADARSPALSHRITFAGKTSERTDFDAVKFAQAIVRTRKPKMTLAERQARQRAMEAKIARY